MNKKPLNTLEEVVFWIDVSNFKKIQDLLKEKHGFVNAHGWEEKYKDEEWFDDCLVYEENGSGFGYGLYRCSFHRSVMCSNGLSNPCLEFRYWQERLNHEQIERDPMLEVVLEVYQMLKMVKVTNYTHEEFEME